MSPLLAATAALLAFQQEPPASDPTCHTPAPAPAQLPMDRKSVLLRKVAEQIDASTTPFLGGGWIALREKRLATMPANTPLKMQLGARVELGDARLAVGQAQAAIGEYSRALEQAMTLHELSTAAMVWKRMAIAWMRVGERANCVAGHNEESCLFPLVGGAIHRDKLGAQQAARLLEMVLKADPADYGSMWLLSVAHMQIGDYPDGVAPQWRLPERALRSERELPRMPDAAKELGLDSFALAGGAAMDDFDGDGRLDIVTSSMNQHESLRMLRQQPDGRFRDVTAEVGLSGQLGGLDFLHFDANNDGRLDLLVQRGAWLGQGGRIPNSLLIQQQDGTFLDRTLEAGIEVAMPSQVAVTADVDNDGDLDLFLGGECDDNQKPLADLSYLFLNRGDGTFEDATEKAGVANARFCKGAAFGDYDGDGRPDLYVSNMRGWNRLYHNLGDGRFEDVAFEQGVAAPYDSFATFFFDYDNDGWLDLFVAAYDPHDRPNVMGAWFRNGATGYDTMRLYRNEHGRFRDATREAGLDRACLPMGCNFGDVDEDGWPDLYLATGDPEFASLWPNVLLRNDRGTRFEDVTAATGTGHLQKGHGVAFGDLDSDGDQDLFVELGGAYLDDGFHAALFRNPGHGCRWLTARLVGHASNRFGVGARVTATIEEPGAPGAAPVRRDVVAFVGANSSFGGNSLQSELGLGAATRIVTLEVFWPRTGKAQRFDDVKLDQIVVIDEDAGLAPVAPRPRAAGAAPGS